MANALEELLEIEKDEKILEYRFSFDDFLMWPVIRWVLFSQAINDYEEQIIKSTPKISHLLKYATNVFMKYPYFVKNIDIISFGANASNVLNDKQYFNRIHDYYNFVFPENTIFFELPDNFEYRKPRAFKNTYYHDYIRIMPILRGKLNKNIPPKQIRVINAFVDYLKSNFDKTIDDSFYETIKTRLIKEEKRLKYRKRCFLKLLDKIKPKVLFLNCAHYGDESYIIKWAKERGIITAEFQHGVVSKMHPAYNYGAAILNSEEYRKYTPDYFLTYGEYWNKQIKIPGETYVVGNPHFHESMKKYKGIKEEENTILIVSQWTLTKEFVEIAKYLAREFKNKKIIFKMHPKEMKNYNLIKPLEAFKNIEIQRDGDIYELLAKYEIIVACYSTTVFEALAFNKRIYILDNSYSKNYVPKEIGIRFKNFTELRDLIINKVKNENKEDIENYFNSNWKENYKKFIEQEIGIKINKDEINKLYEKREQPKVPEKSN